MAEEFCPNDCRRSRSMEMATPMMSHSSCRVRKTLMKIIAIDKKAARKRPSSLRPSASSALGPIWLKHCARWTSVELNQMRMTAVLWRYGHLHCHRRRTEGTTGRSKTCWDVMFGFLRLPGFRVFSHWIFCLNLAWSRQGTADYLWAFEAHP